MQPAETPTEKLQQIKTFLIYRLQHIEKLLSNITDKIVKKPTHTSDPNLK